MPWEGAAKPSVKLAFLSYATNTPQLRVSQCPPAVAALGCTHPRVEWPTGAAFPTLGSKCHVQSCLPLLTATGPHWCDSTWHGQWPGPEGRDMGILPVSEWASWNASFGGPGTGSGPLSGPWYSTHKVSPWRAAPCWGPGTSGLRESGVIISASPHRPPKSPLPDPVCCWHLLPFTPLSSPHRPGSPLQAVLSE